jgi:hypothetical protein
MSWLGNLLGSNIVSNVANAVGGAKGGPNMMNSGIGVPYNQKIEEEKAMRVAGHMKMEKIVASGAKKPTPNDDIARQFGM